MFCFSAKSFRLMVWLIPFFSAVDGVLADDASESNLPTPEQISEWIDQLDADDFVARANALQKLKAAGPLSCNALAEAAMREGRDRRWQALRLLRVAWEEGEPTWREAARQALQKIAAGDRELPAHFAREALRPKPDPAQIPTGARPPRPHSPPGLVNPLAASVHRTAMLQDGPRRVRIVECPSTGIEVQISEMKDGRQCLEEYQAKDMTELEEKHPEVFKVVFAARRQYAVTMLENCRRQLGHCLGAFELAATGAEDAELLTQSIERIKGLAEQLEREVSTLAPQLTARDALVR